MVRASDRPVAVLCPPDAPKENASGRALVLSHQISPAYGRWNNRRNGRDIDRVRFVIVALPCLWGSYRATVAPRRRSEWPGVSDTSMSFRLVRKLRTGNLG